MSKGQLLLLLLLLLLLRQWKYGGLQFGGGGDRVCRCAIYASASQNTIIRYKTIGRVLENSHTPAHSTAVESAVLRHR